MRLAQAAGKACARLQRHAGVLLVLWVCLMGATTEQEKAGLIGRVHVVVQESSTWQEGAIVDSLILQYDIDGNQIESEHSSYKIGEGRLLIKERSVTSYDPKKQRKENISYKDDGSISGKSVSIFDANGNRTEFVAYGGDGAVIFRFVAKYDDKGNNFESISYKSEKLVVSKTLRSFDEKGNAVETLVFKGDGSLDYKVLTKYDSNGRAVREDLHGMGGELGERRTYRYDDKLGLLEKTFAKANGEIALREKYDYEFDAEGNWTKRVTSRWVGGVSGEGHFEMTDITKRQISYFRHEKGQR
ncbi:MAG: hypothetical protein OEV08_15185 [Nitrospira sp.]|nr:hypothetical protein [Nitrospira sp.]